MVYRKIEQSDTEDFHRMLRLLDGETEYMMYEPGERGSGEAALSRLRENVRAADAGGDFLLAAVNEEGEIVGFIWAERGRLNRVRHTAYVVAGVRLAYRRRGIGTEFFRRLDEWAKLNGVTRLELTVECANTGAKELYEKQGFRVEGLRPRSMKVNGRYADEYYMGRLLD